MAEKLIRDGRALAISLGPDKHLLREATEAELIPMFIAKLHEEVEELANARSTEGIIEEAADILQVLYDLCERELGVHRETIERFRAIKRERLGGFGGHAVLTNA